MIIEPVHTSGHAIIEDLQAFANALNPRVLIPIHTFEAKKYPELFENVKILEDGEEYLIWQAKAKGTCHLGALHSTKITEK
jgi:mRNA degradation ribonuclease J1/J2